MFILLINLKFTCNNQFNPKLYMKGNTCMCIIECDLILYKKYNFKKYRKLHLSFFLTKPGTRECYLGTNTRCGYYCLMAASSYICNYFALSLNKWIMRDTFVKNVCELLLLSTLFKLLTNRKNCWREIHRPIDKHETN